MEVPDFACDIAKSSNISHYVDPPEKENVEMKVAKLLIACFLLSVACSNADAQGNNGRGMCMQPFGISFYKVKAGHEDEWLGLFMEWHYPLLEYSLKHGTLTEFKLNAPDGHSEGSAWTFAGTYLAPTSSERGTPPLDRAQLIEKLFGDRMDEYVAGEKRRWALTEHHWDTNFTELDLTESPLSLYTPSLGGCGETP